MWLVLHNQALNFGISEIGMLAQINFGVFMSLDYGYSYVNISKTNISTFFFCSLNLKVLLFLRCCCHLCWCKLKTIFRFSVNCDN